MYLLLGNIQLPTSHQYRTLYALSFTITYYKNPNYYSKSHLQDNILYHN